MHLSDLNKIQHNKINYEYKVSVIGRSRIVIIFVCLDQLYGSVKTVGRTFCIADKFRSNLD